MRDNEVGVALIRSVTRRIDEFLHDNPAAQFADESKVIHAFCRYLRMKDGGTRTIKQGDGMVAQEVDLENIVDEHSAALAQVKLFANGRVGLMWLPQLFTVPGFMSDELREDLIKLLRFHADKMQDRSMDERMKQCAQKMTGVA